MRNTDEQNARINAINLQRNLGTILSGVGPAILEKLAREQGQMVFKKAFTPAPFNPKYKPRIEPIKNAYNIKAGIIKEVR